VDFTQEAASRIIPHPYSRANSSNAPKMIMSHTVSYVGILIEKAINYYGNSAFMAASGKGKSL